MFPVTDVELTLKIIFTVGVPFASNLTSSLGSYGKPLGTVGRLKNSAIIRGDHNIVGKRMNMLTFLRQLAIHY